MRVPALQTIVVKPELIRIVRRENSRKWQVHYKIEGVKTWFRKSVQTTDVDKAIQLAERMWMKATFDHEEGRPVISKKFKPVAEVVLRRLNEEIQAGTARPIAKDYVSAIALTQTAWLKRLPCCMRVLDLKVPAVTVGAERF